VDPILVGIIGITGMCVIMFLGVQIGIAMFVTGFVGFAAITNFDAALGLLKSTPFANASNYALTVIPLFVLMGQFAFYSGLSQELFGVSYKWLGHLRGGLSISTIGACAGFAAICGSSPATAATMGTVALPEMKKYGYADKLACGSVAAGGTLGILIPPSVGFILYGIIAQQSIGRLFAAGVVPGIMLAVLYALAVSYMVRRNPELGPRGPEFSLKERLVALKDVWGVLFLFIFIMGGMFVGIFTAKEAAAAGAFCAMLFMISRGKMNKQTLALALTDTVRTTAMIFIILIGAYVFGYFLAISKIPMALASFITGLEVSKYVVLAGIICIYMLLGCIMDSLAMVLLTVPIFLPIMTSLEFDPVWMGVIMVMAMEQGLITPPVGMNVYVVKGVAKDVPLQTIFSGILPFWICIIIAVVLLAFFPKIALFLPDLLYGK